MTSYQCPCLSRLLDDPCRMRFEDLSELVWHCHHIHGVALRNEQQSVAVSAEFTPAQLRRLRYWQWARQTGRAPS